MLLSQSHPGRSCKALDVEHKPVFVPSMLDLHLTSEPGVCPVNRNPRLDLKNVLGSTK